MDRGQYKKLGDRRRLSEDIDLAELARKQADKAAREKAKMDTLKSMKRAEKLSELGGLSTDDLLKQINIYRLLDDVSVVLYKSSSKLARLETLADLIEERYGPHARDRDQQWIETQAETPARRKSKGGGGSTSSRGMRTHGRTWELHDEEPIQGARTFKGRRQYLVRWRDENPDAPGEAWMTYEHYSSLCVDGHEPSGCTHSRQHAHLPPSHTQTSIL